MAGWERAGTGCVPGCSPGKLAAEFADVLGPSFGSATGYDVTVIAGVVTGLGAGILSGRIAAYNPSVKGKAGDFALQLDLDLVSPFRVNLVNMFPPEIWCFELLRTLGNHTLRISLVGSAYPTL